MGRAPAPHAAALPALAGGVAVHATLQCFPATKTPRKSMCILSLRVAVQPGAVDVLTAAPAGCGAVAEGFARRSAPFSPSTRLPLALPLFPTALLSRKYQVLAHQVRRLHTMHLQRTSPMADLTRVPGPNQGGRHQPGQARRSEPAHSLLARSPANSRPGTG